MWKDWLRVRPKNAVLFDIHVSPKQGLLIKQDEGEWV